MQTKGKKSLKNISMSEVMTELVSDYGGQSAVCRKLGFIEKDDIKRESVKIGHYMNGISRPKPEFLERWKEVFGDDILALERERKVSRGTKKETNITSMPKPAVPSKPAEKEEITLLIRNLNVMGELNMYLLQENKDLKEQLKRKG